MKYITPDYYKEFQCIANRCPDTCCAGWEITIDSKSMKRYHEVQGPFGNRLHNSLNEKQHAFLQYDHKCIFLNEDNLCDMYTEAGEDMLCQTCKMYPRHIESFLNVRELSIALSCPEVARMLLSRKEKVHFNINEVEKREEVDVVFPSYLYEQLNDARQLMFNFLQDRALNIQVRMGLVLGFAHDLQSRIYQRDYVAMARLICHYKKENTVQYLVKKVTKRLEQSDGRYSMMHRMMKELTHLRVLDETWPGVLHDVQQTLYHEESVDYIKNRVAFRRQHSELSIQMEQLMVYFIYGYTNGSVYDGELYSKVKFAVMNTLVIEELFFATYIDSGEQLSLEKQVELAHKYAREIEHLDENIEHLDQMLVKEKQYFLDEMLESLE